MGHSLGIRSFRFIFILATAAMSMCLGSVAVAATDDLTSLSLEDLMDLEVVTASKSAQTASQAPAFTSVITREDIERYGYRTVAEALSRVAGFYNSTDLTYDIAGVRGFAPPGDLNTRILVLVDGHRTNDPVYDYGTLGDDLPIDIEGVKRIEVVRGPGSALWGSNAVLAVVNVVTRKGRDFDGAEGAVEFGKNERIKGHGAIGAQFENGAEFAAMFGGAATDGDDEIYFMDFDDPSTNYGVAEDANAAHTWRGYMNASYKGFKMMLAGSDRTVDDPAAGYGTIFNKPNELTDSRFHSEVSYEHALMPEKHGHFLVRGYYDFDNYRGDYNYDYEDPINYPTDVVNHDVGESQWWGAEARYSVDLLDDLNLIAGFEYYDAFDTRLFNVDLDNPESPLPYYYVNVDVNGSFNIVSGYLQADWTIVEPLRLIAGVRADGHSELDDTQWSPRAALVYSPKQKFLSDSIFKLMFGQSFRAPNAYERDYGDGITSMGNPDLDAEEITTFEALWEQRLFGNTRAVTSLFYFEFDDIINSVENTDTMLLQFQNQGMARSKGIEIEVDTSLKNGVGGHLAFSALRAENKQGRLPNSPDFLLTVGVSVPVLTRRVMLTPEVQFVGDREDLYGNTVEGSTLLNLTLAARVWKGLFASATAYNLSDSDVFIPAGTQHEQTELPLAGRGWRFQLKYHYRQD